MRVRGLKILTEEEGEEEEEEYDDGGGKEYGDCDYDDENDDNISNCTLYVC
jgi:hypothetical protein